MVKPGEVFTKEAYSYEELITVMSKAVFRASDYVQLYSPSLITRLVSVHTE